MARAVTGTLRAVKVVRREDFELERTFEREFEGIRSFEPISRSHPGLIDILHVGRNQAAGFYYYVMELADDRYRGRDITPAEYEPRSLSTVRQEGSLLPIEETAEVGLLLADALAHLHLHGLIHRDVKPSNVIFVDGVAQLADIGLVAAYGQRTYVGTEGFVPPEGPGTPQADTYSLGMVLYELSTGRDRLEFPALPDDLSQFADKKRWRALNEVVCRACAPEPKQRYAHASDMADDLRRVLQGRARKKPFFRRKRVLAAAAVVLAVLAANNNANKGRQANAGGGSGPPATGNGPAKVDPPPVVEEPLFVGPPAPVFGGLRFVSEPTGAEVLVDGQKIGPAPGALPRLRAGEHTVTFRLKNHREVTKQVEVTADTEQTVAATLPHWSPPVDGEPWTNSLGMKFSSRGNRHVALTPTTHEHFVQAHDGHFEEGAVQEWHPPEGGAPSFIVAVPSKDAETFRAWAEEQDRQKGFFGPDHFYEIERVSVTAEDAAKDMYAFRLMAGEREYGDLVVESEPSGATVWEGGQQLGRTPFTLEHRLVGKVALELRMPGFHNEAVDGEIRRGKKRHVAVTLRKSRLAALDREWTNSLGLTFRPVGDVNFCVWETRVKDFAAYTAATQVEHVTDLDQGPDHPVVAVSREDAVAFCIWLTERERQEGLLPEHLEYRLPTDVEWSRAAGIETERGNSPGERNSRIKGVYPWGFKWPPPPGSGNFGDSSAAGKITVERGGRLLQGSDGYPFTTPVGSFASSPKGLHDLAGNVSEWVLEDFGGGVGTTNYSNYGVLRGGSWADYQPENLLTTFRNAVAVTRRESTYGFRMVIAKKSVGQDR